MKRSLLVAVFSVWMVCGAQTDWRFADSTAQWNVLSAQWCMISPCGHFQTYSYIVNGDTLIAGNYYQSIQYANEKYFLRRDSLEKVYGRFQDDTTDNLLYDFGLHINDSILSGNAMGRTWPAQNVMCRVDSMDTVQLDRPRKRMFVKYRWIVLDFWHRADIWIEGIGSINTHFLAPGIDPQALDGPKEDLLCFFENNTELFHGKPGLYPGADTLSCNINHIWISIKETSPDQVCISPNPATTTITLQLQQTPAPASAFQLFDITGRMVLQKPLTETTNRIELNGVSKGMYLYNVVTEGEKAGAGKLIIE